MCNARAGYSRNYTQTRTVILFTVSSGGRVCLLPAAGSCFSLLLLSLSVHAVLALLLSHSGAGWEQPQHRSTTSWRLGRHLRAGRLQTHPQVSLQANRRASDCSIKEAGEVVRRLSWDQSEGARLQSKSAVGGWLFPSWRTVLSPRSSVMEETLTCSRSPFSQVFGRQGQLMRASEFWH